jgi:cytochrome c-type biogenesis protein CcmH/NrfG
MKSFALIIIFSVFVIAAGLYFVAGKSDTTGSPAAHSMPSADNSAGKMQLESVDSMVGGLEERLRQQPDDGKGWLLLAKSYRHLGRLDEARDAYKKAESLGSGDPTVAAQLFGLESNSVNGAMEARVTDMETSQ